MDRMTWDGLNVRDLFRVCRPLIEWNSKHPTNPAVWIVGRSRVRPQDNHVTLRSTAGLIKVYAGDSIIRHEDGSYTVERA